MKSISKILSVVLCLAVVMAMFVIGASAAEQTATLNVASTGITESLTLSNVTTIGGVNFQGSKGSGTAVPALNYSADQVRIYQNSTLTISPVSGCTITKITFVNSSEGNELTSTSASITNGTLDGTTITVTDPTQPVVIKNINTTNVQIRVTNFTVTYTGTPILCTSHVPSATYEMDSAKHWQVCTNNGCGAKVNEADHANTGTCSCGLAVTSIATVLADNTTGDLYRVTGTVTCVSGKNLFIENGTSAINIFKNSNWSGYAVGDNVTATGTYATYNGLKQLSSPTVYKESSGNPVNYITSIAGISESDIGKAIKLTDVSLTVTGKSGSAWVLSDGTNTINWYASLAEGQEIGKGDTVTALTGAISTYNGIQIINAKGDATIVNHTCNFDGAEYKIDGTKHYRECTICGETATALCEGTELVPAKDGTNHWTKCNDANCGYATEKIPHTWGSYITNNAATGHYQKCECGAQTTDETCADGSDADKFCDKCSNNLACAHAVWEPKYNTTKHWEECKACQTKKNEVDHTLTWKNESDKHWQECACGYKSEKANHQPAYKFDNNQHWTVCECGATSEKAYHTLNNNKCDCGYEKVTEGYLKVTNGKLTSGKYVMVLTNGYAPTKMDGTWLLSGTPTIKGNQVTNPEEFVVELIVEGNKVTIKDANGKIIMNKADNNSLQADATEGAWTWEYKDGYFMFHDGKEEARYLASNAEQDNKFRAYRLTSSQASSQTNTFVMYKLTTSGGNSSTGDNSVVSLAVAAAVLSVMGCAVLVSKKKHF